MKIKKAAMELSVSTIVIIVLAVTMLIMGMILVRSIMCAGIGLSGDIENKMKSELLSLFGDKDFGVKCMGSAGQDRPKLADGETQEIYCVIREDRSTEYKLVVDEIITQTGETNIQDWIVDESGWEGVVGSGSQTERIAVLEIPREVSQTTLKVKVSEYRGGSTSVTKTHSLLIDISPTGSFSRAIC
jgi:hypothetical protein